jgi:hypothetical protein
MRFWEIGQIWIFQFTKISQLPKIRPIANLLSSKLLRWKKENPKISQTPKNLPISNLIAKVQQLDWLKLEL